MNQTAFTIEQQRQELLTQRLMCMLTEPCVRDEQGEPIPGSRYEALTRAIDELRKERDRV